MAHINLLPWREELRKKKQQEFVTLLVLTALLGGLLVFAGHILVNNWISGQQAKNDYLQQEIKAVEERLTKKLQSSKKRVKHYLTVWKSSSNYRQVVPILYIYLTTWFLHYQMVYILTAAKQTGNTNLEIFRHG